MPPITQNPISSPFQRERIIVIPGVKGGLARSIYEPLDRQTYQSAIDIDVYNDRDTIRPQFPSLVDLPLPSASNGGGASGSAFKVFNAFLASSGAWYFQGESTISASVNSCLWNLTGGLSSTPSYSLDSNQSGVSGRYPLDEYKDGLFYSEKHLFRRWGNLSGSPSASTIGTLSDTTERFGHFLNHKGLAKIFQTHGSGGVYNKIGWYDNATFTETVLDFGKGYNIVSIDEAGQFVCIGIRAVNDGQRSRYILWDGAAVTVEDSMDLGDTGLVGLRVVNGVITLVTYNSDQTITKSKLRVMEAIPGYTPQIKWQGEGARSFVYGDMSFAAYGSLMFFGVDVPQLMAYGTRFPDVPKYLTDFRSMTVAGSAPSSGTMLFTKIAGQTLLTGWVDESSGQVFKMSTTGISASQGALSTGVYTSELIPVDDNLEFKGSIKKIKIYHRTLPVSCGYDVLIKQYGRYIPGTTIPAGDTFTKVATVTGTNSEYAVIEDDGVNFDLCDSFQIQIKLNQVNQANYPEIVFPIVIRVGISETK